MKRTALALLMLLGLLAPAPLRAEAPAGSLFIVGGGLRYGNAEVWSRLVQLAAEHAAREAKETAVASAEAPAGGSAEAKIIKEASITKVVAASAERARPRIAVFPTASANPIDNGTRIVETLNRYGADAFLVPVALRGMETDYKSAVRDAKLVGEVSRSDGVFFIGGAQQRIVTALLDEEGKQTPLLQAVWAVYRAGGVIAGTSAGAAVMSQVMCRDAERVLATLEEGVTMGKEIDHGFGFLDSRWFVDQHALIRGRFARALVIMKSQGVKYGVGIDENTALEVRKGSDATVVGYKGALVLDLSEAKSDQNSPAFNIQNAKLTYLDRGDSINLKTLEVRPSAEKQNGERLDPASPDYRPRENRTLFYADILGNTTVCDLMANLMENKKNEAIGLAFDGSAVQAESSQGFEFRFYRGEGSLGWATGEYGGSAYTIANVRLDVRPVTIAGPLYK